MGVHKKSRIPRMNEEKMKENFKKLNAQKSFQRRNNKNLLCWAFYYVNDNKEVNVTTLQTMHCILCHNNLILNLNKINQTRKGLIIYNTIIGITALKRHVNLDHSNVLNFFEEEMNCPLREKEKQPSKKKPNISSNSIFNFFAREPFKKEDVQQNVFLENLGLLIVKNHLPFQFVESNWLKKFNMHLCPKIVFPSIT
jgi:hypothetical protein